MAITVDRKIFYAIYVGASTITINSTTVPDINKIVKIIRPSLSSGINTRQSYNGSYNGATPGGAVTTLVPNTIYEFTVGVTNSWTLPDFVLMVTAPTTSPVTIGLDGTTVVSGETIFDTSYQRVLFTSAASLTATFTSGSGTVQISIDNGSNWINLSTTAYSLATTTAFITRVQHTAGSSFNATITATF